MLYLESWDSFRRILPLVLLLGMSPPVSSAQELPSPAEPQAREQKKKGPEDTPNPPSYKRFHKVLGKNLTSNLIHQGNLVPLIIGTAGALAIRPADHAIVDAIRGESPTVGTTGNVLGGPIFFSALTGGLVIASTRSSHSHFKSFAYTFAQAVVVDNLLTQALKVTVQRTRPNGEPYSFPSGHTSNAFAAATVVSHYYGKKWGIPVLALAGVIGLSRIEAGKHWPSDTVGGAALGYISGITSIRGTRRETQTGVIKQTLLIPYWDRQYRGIQVQFRF